MALIGDYNYVPKVAWVSSSQRNDMQMFLKGAVYCWCKNRKGEWFATRDLLGGDNYYWQGTPLIDLFTHYLHQGYSEEEAVFMAGKDAGKLMMEMLEDDKRTYETRSAFTREYRWTGEEDND